MNICLRKIVLATDGSEEATFARRAAADMSNKLEAELHVVHVRTDLQSPVYPDLSWDDRPRLVREEACELLRRQAWSAAIDGGWVAGEHLREGLPAEEINALVEELGANLVVVGNRRSGQVRRLITGSVSDDVVNGASCPVLVVCGGKGAWPPVRIVVGDDGSLPAREAGGLAAKIAVPFGAGVVLVRAYENPPQPVGGWSAEDRRELDEALRRRREDLDERAEQLAALTRCRIETKLIETKASPALSLMARKRHEGRTLLAVGSRGLGGLKRALSGSVSTNVLRTARGPVLVVPSEQSASR